MTENQGRFLKSLSDYLKKLSRNVMRLNTHSEVFKYLNDTFINQLKIEVAIAAFIEDGNLDVVHASGNTGDLRKIFPLPVSSLIQESLNTSLTDGDYRRLKEQNLTDFFQAINIKSWFSLPISDGETTIGIYYLGFQEETKLYDQVGRDFDELGSYIVTALLTIYRIEESQRKLIQFQIETENEQDVQQRIQKITERVVQLAGSGTQSHELGIYLYDEANHRFQLQPTTYGYVRKDHDIDVEPSMPISQYFANLELIGSELFSHRLMLDNQIIGIIYARKSQGQFFTRQDSDVIATYGDYFLTNYSNLQLLYNEANYRRSLE